MLPGIDKLDSDAIGQLSTNVMKARQQCNPEDIPDIDTVQEFNIAVLIGIRDHSSPTAPIAPGVAFISARRTVVEASNDKDDHEKENTKGKPWWQFWKNDCKPTQNKTTKKDQYEITGVKVFGARSDAIKGFRQLRMAPGKENSRLLSDMNSQLANRGRQRKSKQEILLKPGDTLWYALAYFIRLRAS